MSRSTLSAVMGLDNEKAVQAQIVEGLKAIGLRVYETSIKLRGKRKSWGLVAGIDPGIPDLLIAHPSWGPVRCPLEIKGPTTRLSEEQQRDHDLGILYIARSLDDAILSVAAFERRYDLKPIAGRAVLS